MDVRLQSAVGKLRKPVDEVAGRVAATLAQCPFGLEDRVQGEKGLLLSRTHTGQRITSSCTQMRMPSGADSKMAKSRDP
jgi:hypothetical protein